jgi:hypothetical protein
MFFRVVVEDRRREMQGASGTDHESEPIDRYSAVLKGLKMSSPSRISLCAPIGVMIDT